MIRLISLLVLLICFTLIDKYAFELHSLELDEWTQYKLKYGKTYGTPEEDGQRRSLFTSARERIREHNDHSRQASYKLGLNHMADWARGEYAGEDYAFDFDSMSDKKVVECESTLDTDSLFLHAIFSDSEAPLPAKIDWRKVPDRVARVKDQGDCHASWAFAATGVLEGQQIVRNVTKKLVPLSEQELIDCTTNSWACEGGRSDLALKAIEELGGIESETGYPYRGQLDYCWYNSRKFVTKIKGVKTFRGSDKLMRLVANYGPVAVTIHRGDDSIHYESGIYTCSDEQKTWTDWVLIVGYGTDDQELGDYWIAKGSWSPSWGEDGYMRIKRGSCHAGNLVTIALF